MAALIPKNILETALGAHMGVCVQCVEVFVGDNLGGTPCDSGRHLAAAIELPARELPAISPTEPNP